MAHRARRASYEASFKLMVAAYAEKTNNMAASRKYHINERNVRSWRKDKEKLKTLPHSKRARRGNTARHQDLEDELHEWLVKNQQNGTTVTRDLIRMRAFAQAKQQGIQDFRASPGWLDNFMRRKCIKKLPRSKLNPISKMTIPDPIAKEDTASDSHTTVAEDGEEGEPADVVPKADITQDDLEDQPELGECSLTPVDDDEMEELGDIELLMKVEPEEGGAGYPWCTEDDPALERAGPSLPSEEMNQSVSKEDTLRAELLWTMNVVYENYSYSSCEGLSQLFAMMFPDSAIARSFNLDECRCDYLCTFGLAPYFLDSLKNSVKKEDHVVLLFDESLNHVTHSKQMDIHVRMWRNNRVTTHYLNSRFIGHGASGGIGNDGVELNKVLQVSMDGPDVDWRFHDVMQEDIESRFKVGLFNIGSCGLHIVNGAFKTGVSASGWPIENLLSGLYWFFKDSTVRHEDYKAVTGSETFPLKFCHRRWLENVQVVERALSVWDNICIYVKKTKEKDAVPTCSSWKAIETATRDPFVTAKLNFFVSVAKMITPFLTMYQTDRPMILFLKEDLEKLIMNLMRRFIDDEVLKAANTSEKLIKLDPKDKKNHCDPKSIDVGYMTDRILRKTTKVSEVALLSFWMECKAFLVTLVAKLLEKAPIVYPLVRAVSCLDPRVIRSSETEVLLASMKDVLQVFVRNGCLRESMCEDVLTEFKDFVDTVGKCSAKFEHFDPSDASVRADELYYEHMANDGKYNKLWGVVKMILILTHGQATGERGSSVNEHEGDEMSEQTYVAQRIVRDAIKQAGGILEVPITKGMLEAAAGAKQKYHSYLDEQRQLKEAKEVKIKKRPIQDEIDELKTKKARIESDIEDLTKQADILADEAESTGQLELIARSNSLRRSVKNKNKDLQIVEAQLDEKVDQL